MSRLSQATLFSMIAAAAACGGSDDDGSNLVDGAVAPDAGGDGVPDDCVPESDDGRNDNLPEATGLTFAGNRVAVCGTVDTGHQNGDLVDLDTYQLTVAPGAAVVVRLTAPLGGAVDHLELMVRDVSGPRSLARLRAGNAVTTLNLPPGEYTVEVEARSARAPAPIPYRVEMYGDDPATRCPPVPDGIIYREVDESAAGHRANDVIEARNAPPLLETQATQQSGDEADSTGQAVTAGDRFTITGVSAQVASAGDDYHDRDTFSLYTGATTNQLDIRATWDGLADLDVQIFRDGKEGEPMGTPIAALIGEEIVVTSVEPSTPYLLWVGGSTRSTQLPATYMIYVCGREIAPAPSAD